MNVYSKGNVASVTLSDNEKVIGCGAKKPGVMYSVHLKQDHLKKDLHYFGDK